MKSIWLVTSGEYDDYTVIAAFSSKAKADRFIKDVLASNADRGLNDPEEVMLDVDLVELSNKGLGLYYVSMGMDGSVKKVGAADPLEWGFCNDICGYSKHIFAHTIAKSDKQAIEIVNKKRLQMLANGENNEGE